jgi:hypothetical protein
MFVCFTVSVCIAFYWCIAAHTEFVSMLTAALVYAREHGICADSQLVIAWANIALQDHPIDIHHLLSIPVEVILGENMQACLQGKETPQCLLSIYDAIKVSQVTGTVRARAVKEASELLLTKLQEHRFMSAFTNTNPAPRAVAIMVCGYSSTFDLHTMWIHKSRTGVISIIDTYPSAVPTRVEWMCAVLDIAIGRVSNIHIRQREDKTGVQPTCGMDTTASVVAMELDNVLYADLRRHHIDLLRLDSLFPQASNVSFCRRQLVMAQLAPDGVIPVAGDRQVNILMTHNLMMLPLQSHGSNTSTSRFTGRRRVDTASRCGGRGRISIP